MKKFAFVLSALVLAGSVSAQDTVLRTDKTDNTIVISVGACSISRKLDINNQEVYEYTLPVTNCQEFKSYQATVSGKNWNKKYTPVAGTESYSYKIEDDAQIATGGNTADPMSMFQILAQCNDKRGLMKKLQEAQAGKAQCKL